jgi:hypothetical protein
VRGGGHAELSSEHGQVGALASTAEPRGPLCHRRRKGARLPVRTPPPQGARSHRGRGAQLPTQMADPVGVSRKGQGGGHGRRSAWGRGKATASLSEIAAAAHEDEHDAAAGAGGSSLPSAGGTHGPRSGVGEGWRAWCITSAGADSDGAGLTQH